MVSRLQSILKTAIFGDAFFYGLNQVVTLFVPIIIFPLCLKTIGSEKFGAVILAQSIVALIALIGDMGLNVVGVKEINKKNTEKEKSEIIISIYLIRIFIFIILITGLIVYHKIFKGNYGLLLVFFIGVIAYDLFFPRWVFQAQQEAKKIFIYSCVGKGIYVICVVVFLEKYGMYAIPFFYSIGAIISVILGLLEIKHFFMHFSSSKKYRVKNILKQGIKVFVPKSLEKSIDSSFNIILGLFGQVSLVVFSDLILKSIKLLSAPNNILINSTFPYFSKNESAKLFKSLLIYFPLLALIFSMIFYSFWDYITIFMNASAFESEFSVYLLSLIAPLISINWLIGDNYMILKGRYQDYNKSMLIRFISYFFIVALIITIYGMIGDVMILFIVYIFSLFLDTYYKYYVYNKNS